MHTFLKNRLSLIAILGFVFLGCSAVEAGQPITPVAVSGQQAVGTDVAYDYFQASVVSPGLNEAGQVQFLAHLKGIGVNMSNDTAVFAGGLGTLQLVARQGDPAAGFPGRTYAGGFSVCGLNVSGEVLFNSGLDDGNQAFFVGLPGTLQVLAAIGDVIPGAPGPIDNLSIASINDAGRALFGALFSGDWYFSLVVGEPGSLSIAAEPGMQAPGRPPGITFTLIDLQTASLQEQDRILFQALDTGENVNLGIYTGLAGDLALLAHSGDQAAGTDPGVAYDIESLAAQALSASGTVAFGTFLTGIGVNNTNWNGLWVGTPGAVSLVARGGMQAPGVEQGVAYAGVDPHQGFGLYFGPVVNSSGQLAFTQYLTTTPAQQAMWAGPPASLRLVARQGQTAPGLAPG
ncbi:MAG: choice-of-anchor tandem repeat NxxGxxAF-containing protein [Chthoniobacterales bacterium]